MSEAQDVVIIGGGLAGLTLAIQLRRQQPDTSVTVLERRQHPVQEAAHKVGESTVEIAAEYFANVLGLKDYLEREQLRKFGLRFFFGAGRHDDLAAADELGGSDLLAVKSYQLDRGRFENDLGDLARELGVAFIDGAAVTDMQLDGDGSHRVEYRQGEERGAIEGRWLVDASGRAAMVKRKMGWLKDNGHDANAVWFRLDTEVRIDDWSVDSDWQERARALPRWNSTNHLMGPGYWVWLIPLSSGATSFGIVADNDLHDLQQFKTFEGTLEWLRRHEPRCATAVEADADKLMDFRFLRHYSHDATRVFSPERVALTGEAGVFLDPFYSPGSDFIAIANTMICNLIEMDQRGEPLRRPVAYYEQLYFSFYRTTLTLYENQYPGWGDTRLMVLKTIWDYVYYWAVLAMLFYRGRMTDLDYLERHQQRLIELQRLNIRLQERFSERAAQQIQAPGKGVFFNQCEMPLMVELNRVLEEAPGDDHQELEDNAQRLPLIAEAILELLDTDSDDTPRYRAWFGDLHQQLADTGV